MSDDYKHTKIIGVRGTNIFHQNMLESTLCSQGSFSQIECSKVCVSFSNLNHHYSDNFNEKLKTNIQILFLTVTFPCFKFKQNYITHSCTKYHEDSMRGTHLYRMNFTLNDDFATSLSLFSPLHQYCEEKNAKYI